MKEDIETKGITLWYQLKRPTGTKRLLVCVVLLIGLPIHIKGGLQHRIKYPVSKDPVMMEK